MNLSHFAIKSIVPFITGDEFPPYRNGPKLVELFNKYGSRDVYDGKGLPKLDKANSNRPARKQYVERRLLELSGKHELRQLLEEVMNGSDNKKEIVSKVNNILNPEKYGITELDGTYSIQGGIIDKSLPARNEAHFKDIENQILSTLNNARVSIRLVMAWFTNETLFKKLLSKHNDGIDVQLAIYDDGINKKHGVNFSELPNTRINRSTKGGIMHDKFCVIDNQIVITGSYNWTNNAEFKNDENITIEKDPEQASRYSEEFRRLTKIAMD